MNHLAARKAASLGQADFRPPPELQRRPPRTDEPNRYLQAPIPDERQAVHLMERLFLHFPRFPSFYLYLIGRRGSYPAQDCSPAPLLTLPTFLVADPPAKQGEARF